MIRARRGVPVRAWGLAVLVGSVSALASARELGQATVASVFRPGP